MKNTPLAALAVTIAFIFLPALAFANSGDFSGAVAIGTGYAGTVTAPTNGLIVQGSVGIGTTTASNPVSVNGIVQSLTGGFKFPDGTTQTTAATGGSVAIKSVKNQVFTSSGTYTPSTGMANVSVRLIGGGGGGGGASANYTGAGGGGAGGAAEGIFTAATIGSSQTVTIGAGGSAGSAGNHNGGNGGTTSLGSLLTGDGGDGGNGTASGNTSAPGGAGGTASGGDIQYTGTNGGAGLGNSATPFLAVGGAGASGIFSGGGAGALPGGSISPTAGASYGAGGGGGGATTSNGAGAAGSGGVVIVTEYCTQ